MRRRSGRIAAQAIAGMDEQQLRQYFRFPENNNCVRLTQEHLGVCKTNPEGSPLDFITHEEIDINKPNFLLEDLSCISEATYRRLPTQGDEYKENPFTRSQMYCEQSYPSYRQYWEGGGWGDDFTNTKEVVTYIITTLEHYIDMMSNIQDFRVDDRLELTGEMSDMINDLFWFSNIYYYLSAEYGDDPLFLYSSDDVVFWLLGTYDATFDHNFKHIIFNFRPRITF